MTTYGRMPSPFLRVVVDRVELPPAPNLVAMCAGYEGGAWRSDGLAEHLLEWLPEFALNERELRELDHASARQVMRRAAKNLYTSEKYKNRGEIGELLLHVAVRQQFGSIPAVSKIYFKDAANDTVKGFDCVHVVEAADGLELWLGEVKLYEDAAGAVRDVVKELFEHTRAPYLRAEFAAIWRKLDPDAPHRERLRPLLENENTSLDEIFERLCIPVLLTYDSAAVAAHRRADAAYAAAIAAEVGRHHDRFKAARLPEEVRIVLVLVPMATKADLLKVFDAKLKGQSL